MRSSRKPFYALSLAALACALGGMLPTDRVAAQNGLADNATIQASYQVRLAKIRLGDFKLTTTIQGTAYRTTGEGNFSILEGLLYKWRGTTTSTGRVTTDGIQPAQYLLSYRGGKAVEEVRMSFAKGTVTELDLVPRKTPKPDTVPITAKQLQNSLDPMSAAFLFARSADTSGDVDVCRQTVPVFDGRTRFDIKLSPKRRVQIPKGGAYAGPAVVCKAKYVPISGHRPSNDGVRMLSATDEIEIWMVPMSGTGLYVPYKVSIPTSIGYGIATATSFQITGAKRASLD
ncbi:MAG: DUF3108 domain-containing protein [Methyloligella sp. ZOD6]